MSFAIYAVETEVIREGDQSQNASYHSFLLFAEVSQDGDISPMQELHFVFSERPMQHSVQEHSFKKIPCLKGITKPANRDYSKMLFDQIVSGDREETVAQWNKMTEIAGSLSAVKIRFIQNAERNAVNCRTGTKAVLKALGHEFKPLNDNAVSGVDTCVLNKIDDMIVDAKPRDCSKVEVREMQKRFSQQFQI